MPRQNTKRMPAVTINDREDELILLATEEAERRISAGTASDSLIIHYLKQGTVRAQLEKEKVQAEAELAKAKVESIQQAARTEELYKAAIVAMREYTGQDNGEYYDEEN